MSSAPGRLHFVRRLSIPSSWEGLIISSGCLAFAVVGVMGFVADFDTFMALVRELGDDDAVDVGV